MTRLLAIAAAAALITAPVLAGCGSSDSTSTSAATAAADSAAAGKSWSSPPPMAIDEKAAYTAVMRTSEGNISIALDPKQAPKTVNNFVFLAKEGFYDGLTFHRVIPDFVIQGGDPDGNGTGGPGYSFADELPKAGAYKLGSVAMANAGPDTNGSQFFIITGQQGVQLPPNYSLFGQVTKGLDVAEKISTLAAPGTETPDPPVTIEKVTITETPAT
ncbi:MAG: peptidylprolyl isomerase [Thermoleophilia bacterium]|nr:peptidylprolyl isomerase [Thermoleophilia bacterium]